MRISDAGKQTLCGGRQLSDLLELLIAHQPHSAVAKLIVLSSVHTIGKIARLLNGGESLGIDDITSLVREFHFIAGKLRVSWSWRISSDVWDAANLIRKINLP